MSNIDDDTRKAIQANIEEAQRCEGKAQHPDTPDSERATLRSHARELRKAAGELHRAFRAGMFKPEIELREISRPVMSLARIAHLMQAGQEAYGADIPSDEALQAAFEQAEAGAPCPIFEGGGARVYEIIEGRLHVGDLVLLLGSEDDAQPELDVSIFREFTTAEGCTAHYATRAITQLVEGLVPNEYRSIQCRVLPSNPNRRSVLDILQRCGFRKVGTIWEYP